MGQPAIEFGIVANRLRKCRAEFSFSLGQPEQFAAGIILNRQTFSFGLISKWLAERDSQNVFLLGQVHTNNAEWSESGPTAHVGATYHLAIGPASGDPGQVTVHLVTGEQKIRKQIPYSGHPEILKPRAAKAALNLLRLHLLGKS